MDDIGHIVCAFCGSIMGLNRATPPSSDTHALRFFMCDTRGASELRIDRATRPGPSGEDDTGGRE
jgi:hypothetical protein